MEGGRIEVDKVLRSMQDFSELCVVVSLRKNLAPVEKASHSLNAHWPRFSTTALTL